MSLEHSLVHVGYWSRNSENKGWGWELVPQSLPEGNKWAVRDGNDGSKDHQMVRIGY